MSEAGKGETTAAEWEVVVGDELPRRVPPSAPPPVRPQPPAKKATTGPSLRGPAVALLATTLLDAGAAASVAGDAFVLDEGRFFLALVSSLLGLIAGRRRGMTSTLMLLASVGTVVMQVGPLAVQVSELLSVPTLDSESASLLATQAMALLAALRAAWIARKRG